MTGLYLLLPVFLTILASFLVVRAGAIALMMTGIDPQKASFQALSAFTRTGFTTKEAELMLNNPKRRRIITWLIIIGNAGLVAILVTATSSITTSQGYQMPITIVGLVVGTYLLYVLIKHTGLMRSWEGFIQNRLIKSQVFEETVTEDLLHFIEGYGVVRITVNQNSPLAGHSIRESFSPETQLWIVGIERDKDWISLPRPREMMKEGDRLVVYGNLSVLKSVFK
jgi:hypothetical protein